MNTALLLGAGFSYDLGMPTARELTDVFLGAFDRRKCDRLIAAMASHQPFTDARPINEPAISRAFDRVLAHKASGSSNYEQLLAELQEESENPSSTQSDKDSHHYVFGLLYELVYDILLQYHLAAYETSYRANFEWFAKLENILADKRTWVFSLNHDLFFECLAIDLDIPVTYGDVGTLTFPITNKSRSETLTFSSTLRTEYGHTAAPFQSELRGVNLVKLHGSLTELEYSDSNIILNIQLARQRSQELIDDLVRFTQMAYFQNGTKIPSGRDRVITRPDGQLGIATKAMLTGGRKYSTTANVKEGEEKLRTFDWVLHNTESLTIIGYGFGDKHVNFRLSNAMARNERLSIRIVDPMIRKPPEFLQPFDYDNRMRSAMCGAAHWMDYCKSNKWDERQLTSLKENQKFRASARQKVESIFHR